MLFSKGVNMPLSEDMHSLTQSIIASQEARDLGLSAIRASAAGQRKAARAEIQACEQAHQTMAQALKGDLAKCHSDRAQAEGQRTAGFQCWIKQLSTEHQAMASSQKAHLAQCHNDRSQIEAQRHAQASAWLGGVATARYAAHADWLHMAETVRGIRARNTGCVAKAPTAPNTEEVSEEEAVTRVQVGQVTPEFSSLRGKAFEYLAGRPDGTRLTELEQAIGISRVQMARIMRSLMDEGKAEKRGQLYFAV